MDSVSKRGLENMLPEIERETGIRFEFDTICEVIRYAARKLNAIGKGAEYFPVLLESELRDYATREIINMKGEINCVRKMIIAVISGVWNSIVAIWSGLASWFGSIWEAAKSAVVEKITQIKDAIVNGFNAAIEWIKSLPAQAYQWGADIINSIANGIRGAIGAVGDAVSGVANKIKSFLHFSEPDEGPLSNFHTYMPDMIDLMARGIRTGKEKVGKALTALTGDMSVIAQNNVVSPGTVVNAGGGSGVSRSVTQNVNIQNTFNGDRAGQKKSADAMDKASGDATQQMARAIAFL